MERDYTIQISSFLILLRPSKNLSGAAVEATGAPSHDFEDLIFVFNNRSAICEELKAAPENVHRYLKEQVSELVHNLYLYGWISANLEYAEQQRARNIQEHIETRFAL